MLTMDQLKLMTEEQIRWWVYDGIPRDLLRSAPLLRRSDKSNFVCQCYVSMCINGDDHDYDVTCKDVLPRQDHNTFGLVIEIENWFARIYLPSYLKDAWGRLATLLNCRLSSVDNKGDRFFKLRLHALRNDYPMLYTAIAIKVLAVGSTFYLIKDLKPTELEQSDTW